mmetsp:Transcript_21016/g.20143  ORF Transcript_21016/g.20143 Transcript_21016/m.20143 type:complete len:122 (-) Transcript_21016:689-1054(-)
MLPVVLEVVYEFYRLYLRLSFCFLEHFLTVKDVMFLIFVARLHLSLVLLSHLINSLFTALEEFIEFGKASKFLCIIIFFDDLLKHTISALDLGILQSRVDQVMLVLFVFVALLIAALVVDH